MKVSKKVLLSSLLALTVFFVSAQEKQVQKKDNSSSEKETSVESEYLNSTLIIPSTSMRSITHTAFLFVRKISLWVNRISPNVCVRMCRLKTARRTL